MFVVLNILSLEDVEVAFTRVEEYALDVNDDDGFDDEATTKVVIVEGVPVVVVNIIIFTVVFSIPFSNALHIRLFLLIFLKYSFYY